MSVLSTRVLRAGRRNGAQSPQSRSQRVIGGVTIAVLVVLVAVPLFFLLLAAFRDEPPGIPAELTWDNFAELLTSDAVLLLRNSLIIGIGTTLRSAEYGHDGLLNVLRRYGAAA